MFKIDHYLIMYCVEGSPFNTTYNSLDIALKHYKMLLDDAKKDIIHYNYVKLFKVELYENVIQNPIKHDV